MFTTFELPEPTKKGKVQSICNTQKSPYTDPLSQIFEDAQKEIKIAIREVLDQYEKKMK